MKTVVLLSEPTPWLRAAIQKYSDTALDLLAPWALPPWAKRLSPSPLKRFIAQRTANEARGAMGFTALEVFARLYSRGQRDKIFQSQFGLRQAASIWAARTSEVQGATCILAPSLSARRPFAANSSAEAVLLLDLPLFRTMHEDLDRAAAAHPDCAFLRRYRAPGWAIVEQECEIAMANRIVVRGRFAQQELIKLGVPPERITMAEVPHTRVRPRRTRVPGELHVLLPGLAAARHGTEQVLAALNARPWLRIALRPGEGAEPASLIKHPQVRLAHAASLCEVDALLAPSLCEAYFPEVRIAAASGIPVIATMRAAGAVPHEDLTIELPSNVQRCLACALDALHGAEPSKHVRADLVSAQLPALS